MTVVEITKAAIERADRRGYERGYKDGTFDSVFKDTYVRRLVFGVVCLSAVAGFVLGYSL